MFQFEKIDISTMFIIAALSITLIIAVFNGMNELSMSIASGFLGYIGRGYQNQLAHKDTQSKDIQEPTQQIKIKSIETK